MRQRPHPILLMMSEVLAFGGAENFFYLLVKHLDRRLFTCRVVVPREGDLVDRLRQIDVPIEIRPLRDPWNVHRLPWFIRYLSTHDIRLINAHGVRAGFFAGLARKRLPIKVVVTEHNLQEWRNRIVPRVIDRFISRNNDRRTTVSQAVADGMISSGVCSPDMVDVIHVAVETDRFRLDPAVRQAERERLDVGPDELLVVAAGRLHRMKGFIYLVEASPRILTEVPQARIVIAGDGEERTTLRKRIDELGTGDRVRLTGYVDRMPELLSAADVFVLPSVQEKGCPQEGLPMVITEALASGCPVVTTTVSGNKEIVHHEYNGLLVPDHDSESLAKAVSRLLTSPDRKRYGENARVTVEERFSIGTIANRYASLYLDLIENGEHRAR